MRMPPHRLMIRGKPWTVRYGDPKGGSRSCFYGGAVIGLCCRRERMILLHPNLRWKCNRKHLWRTFAHELLHALDWKLSHRVIERMEGPLGALMTDNRFFLEEYAGKDADKRP